jgi:1A family penicillin-binding protein
MRPRLPTFQFVHSTFSGRPRFLVTTVAVLAIALFLISGWALWFTYDLTARLPGKKAIRALGDMAQATTILDASDKPAFIIFKEQRIEVPLEKISPNLINAVISVEDQRFYEHSGVDAVRVAAAIIRNFHEGRRAEGGSTITQQLARQSFLSRDKTYRRKLQEVILAAYIERMYDKKDILELYLNKVYFGGGLYGAEAAARGYFGKPASDLSVDEAALLAGLIQSPSSYAPTVNLERAVARRSIVLQSMVANGAINQAAADRAKKAPVHLVNGLEINETSGLYFKEQVRRELVERFGSDRVYQGGLRVHTTLDFNLQQTAEQLVEKRLAEIEQRPGYKHPTRGKKGALGEGELPAYLQGALIAIDPGTGYVRAMVGGRNFNESRFNRATQAKRQAGSAFKPFVYAAALEAGYSPATVITRLNDPIETPQGGWVPEDEHSTAESMTIRTALRTSSNRAAVRVLDSVGIPTAVQYAQRLNVGTPPSVPSLALGSGEVSLISMTSAYAAFASGGIIRQPVFIRRVEDSDGKVLFQAEDKPHRAVSEATAFLMTSMLADVINSGTAYRARQVGFTLPAAGKTGTTNDYDDAWFIGFTPHLVTGVWIGFDRPTTIVSGGYAGELAVPLWASFMKSATSNDKPDWFKKPDNVVAVNVCRVSGKLPNVGCSNVETVDRDGMPIVKSMIYTEYFVRGTEPTSMCPVHPGAFSDVADLAGDQPAPRVAADQARIPPPKVPTTGAAPPPAPESAEPIHGGQVPQSAEPAQKKRGFWGRIFGRGDKGTEKKKEGGEW